MKTAGKVTTPTRGANRKDRSRIGY